MVAAEPASLLERLLAEEAEVQLPAFDLATALELGNRLLQRALRDSLPVAIEIARAGHVVFFAMLPGASPNNSNWVRRKRAVVEQFHHSSLYVTAQCELQGRDFHERYSLPREHFAASGGGVPIFVRGTGFVGAAAVSGLAAVDDHAMIVAALRDMIRGAGEG